MSETREMFMLEPSLVGAGAPTYPEMKAVENEGG